ncbi:hypothetical protein NCCP28_21400 [Niallia sp. NCCP-28]|nr:hypothetical protein NCCP28_21400 [Niallia sp. NCCP-28]
MLKKIKANKVYIEGIFFILFISTIIMVSYILGFSDLKKILGL